MEIENVINGDIENIISKQSTTPKLHFPKITVKGIDVSTLRPRDKSDTQVEISVVSLIRNDFASNTQLRGMALLLDRDLMVKNGVENKYLTIVKHGYFSTRRYPGHYMCCFGGTPSDGMRCSETVDKKCLDYTHSTCTACKKKDNIVVSCKHTCYWYLISVLLGLVKPRGNAIGSQTNELREADIVSCFPVPYKTPHIY